MIRRKHFQNKVYYNITKSVHLKLHQKFLFVCFLIVFVYFLVPVLMKFDTNQLWASLTAFVKLLAGFTGAFCSRSFG